MVFYMMLYAMSALPQEFATTDPRQKTFVILSFLTLSVMFPVLGIALLKWQGLISSFRMEAKKERIGPLIVIAIFYLWLYVNIRSNTLVPDVLSFFVLGAIISIFIGLFINSFSKVSLHCIGAGGLVTGMVFIISQFTYPKLVFPIGSWVIMISQECILLLIILAAGLIGTARKQLSAHEDHEIYGGYIVGIFSQIIAIIIYF